MQLPVYQIQSLPVSVPLHCLMDGADWLPVATEFKPLLPPKESKSLTACPTSLPWRQCPSLHLTVTARLWNASPGWRKPCWQGCAGRGPIFWPLGHANILQHFTKRGLTSGESGGFPHNAPFSWLFPDYVGFPFAACTFSKKCLQLASLRGIITSNVSYRTHRMLLSKPAFSCSCTVFPQVLIVLPAD